MFNAPRWLVAGLLRLVPALSFCRAQESLGYAMPDFTTKGKLITRTYLVADLVCPRGDGKPMPGTMRDQQLINLLTNSINPDSWSGSSGPGIIDYFPLGMTLV